MEAPTYLGAVAGFSGFGGRVTDVPMDADGLDIDAPGDEVTAPRTIATSTKVLSAAVTPDRIVLPRR